MDETVTRVCSYCCTRQPLAALAQVVDSLQCADLAACSRRAQASGLYALDEREEELASREARQGAVR